MMFGNGRDALASFDDYWIGDVQVSFRLDLSHVNQ